MPFFTRRQFLRAAGGVTFLALAPIRRGVFAATNTDPDAPALPLFTALPYIQPGNASKLVPDQERIVVAWQTVSQPATFEIAYGLGKDYNQSGTIEHHAAISAKDDGETRTNYAAHLSGLALNKRYNYRVRCNGTTILEGYFTTRKPRGSKIHFVAFGDNSYGEISDRNIAYQAYLQKPDFVMNTGDNVYEGGLANEYERYFFPVYNADVAESRTGAPLLRSVPFYTVIANHDVHGKGPDGPVADFVKEPDSLGYYSFLHLPLNGPAPAQPTPTLGDNDAFALFKLGAGEKFPRMANYSFDYGDAHFTCIDSNVYIDPTNAALQTWIDSDLAGTDAIWKFVVYHHPAFNVGHEHYEVQHMRVLSPLLEKHGVDFVLNGHEHVYQRSLPLKFVPGDLTNARAINEKDRRTPGAFTVDAALDGASKTKADGVIYVTTGAGGKHLYDPDLNADPAKWTHDDDGNVAYVSKFVSDRHSLTVFDIDGKTLKMAQIDQFGKEIDHITVTKA